MAFNSLIFIFLFLPVALTVLYFARGKSRCFLLILFNLLFYTWGDQAMVLLLTGSALVNYYSARWIKPGNRVVLTAMLLFNILLLGVFKYVNFGIETVNGLLQLTGTGNNLLEPVKGLVLPLGISYYTFRAISYNIDVSRGKIAPSQNLAEFLAWFTLFPLITAGPIARWSELRDQMGSGTTDPSRFVSGIRRFMTGMIKKVLIAGTFAAFGQQLSAFPAGDISMVMAWAGIITYTLEIYFDFSGYTDMAIGVGLMLGFVFPENFNYPFTSKNIREFWRRWHISLSSWLREYLFLPLSYSVSRKLKRDFYFGIKTDHIIYSLASLVTFVVCGLWHGAAWTYVAWGFYFGVFLILEQVFYGKLLKKVPAAFQHLYALLVITCSFVIFRAATLGDAADWFGRMFSFSAGNVTVNSYIQFFSFHRELGFALIAAVLFSMPVSGFIVKKLEQTLFNRPWIRATTTTVFTILLTGLFILSVSYLVSTSYHPFIYLKF